MFINFVMYLTSFVLVIYVARHGLQHKIKTMAIQNRILEAKLAQERAARKLFQIGLVEIEELHLQGRTNDAISLWNSIKIYQTS